MLVCPHCGYNNRPGPATCEKCGKSLRGAAERTEDAVLKSAQPIKIVDIDIPFSSLFALILKATIASIPAAIVMIVLGAILGALISSSLR